MTRQCWSLLTVGGGVETMEIAREMLVADCDVPLEALVPLRRGAASASQRWGTERLRILTSTALDGVEGTLGAAWLAQSPRTPPDRWFAQWMVTSSLLGHMRYVQPALGRAGRLDLRLVQGDGVPFGDSVGRLAFWRPGPEDSERFLHNTMLFGYRHQCVSTRSGPAEAAFVRGVIRLGWRAWEDERWEELPGRRVPEDWRPDADPTGEVIREQFLRGLGIPGWR